MKKYHKLTRQNVKALKPGQSLTEHGITAERKTNGDVRWSVSFMVDGQRVHRVVGNDSDGVRRQVCEQFIEAKKTEAREGRLNLPTGRKVALGFKAAAQKYLDKLEESGGKNIDAKRRHINTRLGPNFKNTPITLINELSVEQYKKKRLTDGHSLGSINRELATLSHIFNKCVEWKWLREKPCKVKLFKEAEGRIIALSDKQCNALMEAAIADEDSYTWLFVAFGLNTAMRHSEILKAKFEHIDFENLRLEIPEAKAGARVQPITKELADILTNEKKARPKDEWVFPTPRPNASKKGYRDRMDKPFRRAVIAADLDPRLVTPHVMRHTAITALVQAGVDLPTIQRIAGHKTLTMVLRYAHVHGTHIDNAMQHIGRALPTEN